MSTNNLQKNIPSAMTKDAHFTKVSRSRVKRRLITHTNMPVVLCKLISQYTLGKTEFTVVEKHKMVIHKHITERLSFNPKSHYKWGVNLANTKGNIKRYTGSDVFEKTLSYVRRTFFTKTERSEYFNPIVISVYEIFKEYIVNNQITHSIRRTNDQVIHTPHPLIWMGIIKCNEKCAGCRGCSEECGECCFEDSCFKCPADCSSGWERKHHNITCEECDIDYNYKKSITTSINWVIGSVCDTCFKDDHTQCKDCERWDSIYNSWGNNGVKIYHNSVDKTNCRYCCTGIPRE